MVAEKWVVDNNKVGQEIKNEFPVVFLRIPRSTQIIVQKSSCDDWIHSLSIGIIFYLDTRQCIL